MSPEIRDDADGRELDARMLSDLRAWRNSPRVAAELDAGKQAFLDRDELDMLLRIADERDALRRQATDLPDEISTAPSYAYDLPPGYAIVHGEVVKLGPVGIMPDEPTELPFVEKPVHRCIVCAGEVRMLGGTWLHLASGVGHRPVMNS